jgi:NADH:ubiquinone oxidoreductase subunit F (NADH-binding)
VGVCHQTPLVEIQEPGRPSVLYARVRAEDAQAIIARHFRPRGALWRVRQFCSDTLDHLLTDETWEPVDRKGVDAQGGELGPFLGPQRHLATEHGGTLDPLDFDEYLRRDGFQALKRCLKEYTPERIIEEIGASGLRGRGGAGFPTGLKWSKVRAEKAEPKYVICNGDEGDPGAFMDRMLLESFPYRILEGMLIAARAVGASEGILYIRAEYPLAVKRIREALDVCEHSGWLGRNIQGSGFSLKLRIFEGAGAFVCGEETALLESIEGRRGIPRVRPPFPASKGLFGQPTLINNVETYALVPWIIRNGAAAFASLGTEKSKGTKVFALAGKVARGGLIEVPMGMTIRQIVEDIGGGVAGGRKFKAVQIGGPSGGCVPAELADTPVDFEALAKVGAIMGSGGLVVLDDSDCMVDIARYFLQFTQNESCGRCTFCRVGTRRMLDILEALCNGQGKPAHLDELDQLARQTQQTSLCGLGRTAPNPVLSTLRFFRAEYEAHVQKRCPVGRCKALIKYVVTDKCIGCTRCAQFCAAGAIAPAPYQRHVVDNTRCTRCDTCRQGCPEKAIIVE